MNGNEPSWQQSAEAAFRAAESGHDELALELLKTTEAADSQRGWLRVLSMQQALLSGEGAVGMDAPNSHGWGVVVRSAVAAWDVETLSQALERWGDDVLERRLATTWLQVFTAPDECDVDVAAELGQAARRAGHASATIEAQALVAMAALGTSDVARAIQAARRASRMARSEGLRYAEILANIVLARVRRHQNAPHLAVRILRSVARHAPPVWHPWIAWELSLCGQGVSVERAGQLAQVTQRFALVLRDEAAAADLAGLVEAQKNTLLRNDMRRALWVFTSSPIDEAGHAWAHGHRDEPPEGSAGLVFLRSFGADDGATSYVYLSAGEPARRIAAPMVAGVARQTGALILGHGQKPHTRLDTGLALLAFRAREDWDIAAYFEALFGYAYDSGLHWGIFSSHVHRLRARVADSAEILRSGDGIRLQVRGPTLVRDPRSQESVAQRALRALAGSTGMSAKDLARELHVPLRTIQRVVGELVGEETLTSAPKGRSVVYTVEDTTFSDATESRAFSLD